MQNDDILAGYQWLATLDPHTCLKCAARDGLRYTLDFQPIGHSLAWGRGPGKIHRRCRCTRTFVLKSAEQMRLNGLAPSTRASAQGQVPADLTYNDWLRTEPAYVATDVLGVTCATIWRTNNLHLMDLLGADGKPMKVRELLDKYPMGN